MRLWISIIFNLTLCSVFGQDISTTYNYAVSSLNEGNLEEAISNLRRVVYFANGDYKNSYLLLGDIYNERKEKKKAMLYYKLAYDSYNEDSLKLKSRFRIIHLHLKYTEPNFALLELYSLPKNLEENDLSLLEFYMSLAYFQLKDFKKSKEHCLLSIGNINSKTLNSIESLYAEAERNEAKKVNVPMFLSIVPGMGQLYLHEYNAAINSFTLSLGFSVLYIYAFKNLSTLDAILTVMPWFHRYYTGGMLQTKKIAVNQKENRHKLLYNKLLEDIYK